MIRPIGIESASIRGRPSAEASARRARPGAFSAALGEAMAAPGPLRFSAHASQRLEQRGIALSGPQLQRVDNAVAALAGKGARESLLLVDGTALVVSIPNRTVITAVPANEMADAVFTQIDSAVVVAGVPGSEAARSGPDPLGGGLPAAERLTRPI